MSSESEVWRQYGVMVHDTPETLGGMLRIQNGSGDAVAFAIDHETANTITKAVNCHEELVEACKVLLGLVESGHLVRDVSKDGEADFALRQLPLIKALKHAQTALEKAGAAL